MGGGAAKEEEMRRDLTLGNDLEGKEGKEGGSEEWKWREVGEGRKREYLGEGK